VIVRKRAINKMKKTIFLSIALSFFFSACFSMPSFSMPSLNPFSKDEKSVEKKEIEIPSNAPLWLKQNKVNNQLSSIGVGLSNKAKLEEKDLTFLKQKALINAGQNLSKKIYFKTIKIYRDYLEKLDNPNIFDKDIKKLSENVALQSLKQTKILKQWSSNKNKLYVQIAVISTIVASEIQNNSKKLFKVDKTLYTEFLSNRAKEDIIKESKDL
jgi:hypothetical protein